VDSSSAGDFKRPSQVFRGARGLGFGLPHFSVLTRGAFFVTGYIVPNFIPFLRAASVLWPAKAFSA